MPFRTFLAILFHIRESITVVMNWILQFIKYIFKMCSIIIHENPILKK